ncbi:lipopolysaccharide assembly protein LapA domain-containing protein [Ideonella sp. A 288]|uniref:lipopolysaccharide assembly protein LapA domain-containing protein n=1 Tax=Ideonella sp. A 288 TaxID=1962181 RepID=UPI000B4B7CF5|nr:lipopolysaccharide assembly protein LapA domain-containing protein [Ideonella sp. A 288]
MRLIVWALRAFIFFTLFAFALNNEQAAVVHGFFGTQWRAPMVIIVLAAFGAGAALGVLAMVPGWWRQRRMARQAAVPSGGAPRRRASDVATSAPSTNFSLDAPPREGL